MTIQQADTGFEDQKTYQLKIKITDLLMMDPVASAIETFFTVTVYHKCSRNEFTISDQQDVTYDISALVASPTAVTNVPISTVTGNTAGCVLTYTVEIYDYPKNDWVVISQANTDLTAKYHFIVSVPALDDTTSNAFDVQTVDFSSWANTTQRMRLRVADLYSTKPGGNRVDEFRVIITYICNRDEITITPGTPDGQVPNQVYLFNAAAQTITPTAFTQLNAGCLTTYKLEIFSVP
jgi:hypothetical protein